MRRKIIKAVAFFLVVFITACCCGCGDTPTTEFSVTVTTEGGLPLEDISVKVYADKGLDDLVWAADTDREGKFSFAAPSSDKYAVVLSGLPSGYSAEEYYILDDTYTVKVKSEMVNNDNLSDITYSLGNIVRDFSLIDVKGVKHQVSEILKEKKALVLNFWFLNCQPCKMEFPFLQKAYEKYSSDIEVIAINPLDGDNTTVSDYADDMGITFAMVSGNIAWQDCMQLNAYPTTVVIDRFGSIAMMHKGSITEEGVFEKIFEYFAADNYKQSIIKNISDIN